VFDLKDLRARTHELANFVTDAAKVYGFDPGRLVAVGYSNGANIAASVLLLRPGTFHRAVLFRAMVPLVPETRPDLQGTSVFLSEGRFDPIIPAQQGERLADMLRKSGADVTIHIVPASHGLIVDDVRQAAAWLGDLLGAPVAG
jgi:predicted esterase